MTDAGTDVATRLDGLLKDHRRQVVGVYLAIRLAFILASLTFLALLSSDAVRLPDQLAASPQAPADLWKPWWLFFSWSLVLFGVGTHALRGGGFKAIDRLIWISLFPDGLAVLLAANAAGGGQSPFYHSVYFLIAIHSYHLIDLGSFARSGEPSWRRLLARYVVFSVVPSVLISMIIYELLSRAGVSRLDFWLELGLQLITASAFMLLGLTNLWRFRQLAAGEEELHQASLRQIRAESDVAATLESLRRTEVDLTRTRQQQERLVQALTKVTNIAEMQTEVNLREALRGLAEEIGRTLEAEYCAIGLARETRAEDAAVWTSRELSPVAKQRLEDARFAPLEGSLVGAVMCRYKMTFEWFEDLHGDLLDPENEELRQRGVSVLRPAADSYSEILPSGRNRSVLLTPFFAPGDEMRPVGYVHLINRRTDLDALAPARFSDSDRATLEAIAPQLAIAIENFRNQQREQELKAEAEVFESLATNEDSNSVFNGLLAYINRAIDSRVASLWLPIEDGFGEPEEVRKLLLRAVHVRGDERGGRANEELARKLRQKTLYRLEESFLGQFLAGSGVPRILYEANLGNHQHCWKQHLEEIGSSRLIVVPVADPLPEAFAQEQEPAWKGVMAILCLRPLAEEFVLSDEVRERLERFSRQLGELILQRRLKRRFEQIGILQKRLRDLEVSDLAGFYGRLVELVREVMGAEACSLFMTDRAPGALTLKATTAERARVSQGGEPVREVPTSSCIDQPIFSLDDESLTSATYHHGAAALVHNTLVYRPESARFREVTKNESARSLVAAPIVRSDGQRIGVLRCINQDHPSRVMPGFLQSDRDFLALLTGIMARFIESARAAEIKSNFLNELSHELATPLLQAQLHVSFLEKVWKRDREARDPTEQLGYLRESLQSVAILVRDIQYQHGRTLSTLGSYDFSKQVDLHQSLEMIRKLFLHDARVQRACEIHGLTRSLPKLLVDKQRMEQVFYNLIQNAIKYSRWAGGTIRVRHRAVRRSFPGDAQQEWHQITVSNFGIGVPPGEEESIFSEYVRGSNVATVSGGQSGTGLGLAVSRRIVENHGGHLILLQREAPTTFAVFLPTSLEGRSLES